MEAPSRQGTALRRCAADRRSGRRSGSAGPLPLAGEGQGEGRAQSGDGGSLTPTLSRTGEGACRAASEAGA
ncbi:hypothetical protein CIW48_15850 [Methylobacterium sp. P1-11]|nr:hypothetical protein CIW48_15850 [Methylobacterium sp. P1-11]